MTALSTIDIWLNWNADFHPRRQLAAKQLKAIEIAPA